MDSGTTYTKSGCKVLRLALDHDQIIEISRKISTTFTSPKRSLMTNETRQKRD